jgi:tetratricopeptide (TPR) repeat protein
MSAILEKIGETLIAQGDVAGGLDHLRQGLDTQRRLSAMDPDNTDMRRDVAKRVARVGELLILKSTLTSFRAGPQRESGPGATDWQLRASWSLKTAGSALADRGDLAGALAFHRECLDIGRGLVARDPDDPAASLDLSYSLQAVADALAAQGDFTAALAACRDGLAIRRALSATQPGNHGLHRDVSVSLVQAAGLLQATGDLAGALGAYRDADVVMRAMSPGDADEPQRQNDLAVLAERIAALEQGL